MRKETSEAMDMSHWMSETDLNGAPRTFKSRIGASCRRIAGERVRLVGEDSVRFFHVREEGVPVPSRFKRVPGIIFGL